MADETVAGDGGGETLPGNEITRPDSLPETYWDPDANAPKYDILGTDLTELATLRTARDEHAAKIPQDGKYKVDLPADFKVPEGKKWSVPAEVAEGLSTLAKEHGLTQDAVTAIAAFKANLDMQGEKAVQDFYTAETKALGEGAPARREALKTWLTSKAASGLTKDQAEAMLPMLDYRHGVEALESLKNLAAVAMRGQPSNGAEEDKNSALVESIGKPGFKAMDVFTSAQRGN